MIEQRKLTRHEIVRLINEAPDEETRNLKKFIAELNRNNEKRMDAYDFFEAFGIDYFGLLTNGRPIYMAILTLNDDDDLEFWTVSIKDPKYVLSLCKYVKRELVKWVEKYGEIFATMEKDASDENKKWTEWIGFHRYKEDNDTITFRIANKILQGAT